MRYYCTLFDRNYLARGLSLYTSLQSRSSEPFRLYVLALDESTFQLLNVLNAPDIVVIPLQMVEMKLDLYKVRESRNWREYCWTLASQLMEYLMGIMDYRWGGPRITYLDSDLYFFADPEIIHHDIYGHSIAIVPHRFPSNTAKRLTDNGAYNVGWLSIDPAFESGRKCLTKWAAQCRDWCYHRNESGKFADQGYLNSWPEEYGESCFVIKHIGVGLAPWNSGQYNVNSSQHQSWSVPKVDLGVTVSVKREHLKPDEFPLTYPVIFYHFHEFEHDHTVIKRLTRWPISTEVRQFIYGPYIGEICRSVGTITELELKHQQLQDELKRQGERA